VAARSRPPRALPDSGRERRGRPGLSAPRFERYVALGDSSTEGLADGDPRLGYRGWSRRLAARIAAAQGGLLYANLASRGRTTREIRERQLAPALALRPDLATLFSGTNDVLALRFDLEAFTSDTRAMQRELRAAGAVVLTFTLPDLTPLLPLARLVAPRILAMNERLRAVCAETGTRLVDFAAHPVATDARLWNADRIHANPAGHARIADALAECLGLPGANGAWREPLPALPPPGVLGMAARESAWVLRHLLPWCVSGLVHTVRRPPQRPGAQPELRPLLPG
jgi:lysophospholipase L1-like esterase